MLILRNTQNWMRRAVFVYKAMRSTRFLFEDVVFLFSLMFIWLAEQFLQHVHAFFVILRLAQPEGLFVLHDVGQHGASLEDHVLTTGRVLDADPELLHGRTERKRRMWTLTFTVIPNSNIYYIHFCNFHLELRLEIHDNRKNYICGGWPCDAVKNSPTGERINGSWADYYISGI